MRPANTFGPVPPPWCWLWGLLGLCGPAMAAETGSAKEAADTTLVCDVRYQPGNGSWDRTVTLTHQNNRLRAVAIDGVKVYTFRQTGREVRTALDNERIVLDLEQVRWRSDFRGVAQGEGPCAWLSTAPRVATAP